MSGSQADPLVPLETVDTEALGKGSPFFYKEDHTMAILEISNHKIASSFPSRDTFPIARDQPVQKSPVLSLFT